MKMEIIFWNAMSIFWGIMTGLFIGYELRTSEPTYSGAIGGIISCIICMIAILRTEFLLNADEIIVPEDKEQSKKLSPHNRHKANDENE